jgi:hypothetical protein
MLQPQCSEAPLFDLSYVVHIRKLNRMLCAMLLALEKTDRLDAALLDIDYEEGGFTREELEQWWAAHKDEYRATPGK